MTEDPDLRINKKIKERKEYKNFGFVTSKDETRKNDLQNRALHHLKCTRILRF